MVILGISAYYHDSAASIIKDGEIIAAAQEERFTRIKGDFSFPHHAINYCLNELKISIEEVDYIIFYENPIVKFQRLLVSFHVDVPKSIIAYLRAMPKWIVKNVFLENIIRNELGVKKKIIFGEHHLSHAASAFYPSPFKEAAILTIDGVGEWSTTTYGIGKDNKIKLLEEITFPNSLGLLYSAFTYLTGFKINSGEYKMMGLAPYGKPTYVDLIKEKLIHMNEDGTIILNQKYFNYVGGVTTMNRNFYKLFGKRRKENERITQREMDLARSIQEICNESIIKMCKYVKEKTKLDNIVLAGGVALNVVSMGKIEKECNVNVWIQPAASDAGGSLGAALWYYYDILNEKRIIQNPDSMKYSFLGPNIENENLDDDNLLKKLNAKWMVYKEEKLVKKVAELLNDNQIVAIARGRMEWGARALGNRSILANATNEKTQSVLNLKVKKRESFRPFAPIVLEDDAHDYFDITKPSPYMLKTYYVRDSIRINQKDNTSTDLIKRINQKRSIIPAVTHVDYSARVETVNEIQNPFIYNVLKEYKKLSGCSVLVNTSFNVRGEPIVCSVEDSYLCFMNTEIDYLVIGNRLLCKKDQKYKPKKKVKFKLD